MKIALLALALAVTVFCDISLRGPENPLDELQLPKITETKRTKAGWSLSRKTFENEEQQRPALKGKREPWRFSTISGQSTFLANGGLRMQQNSRMIGKLNMQQAIRGTQQLTPMNGGLNGRSEAQTENKSSGRWTMQQRSLSGGRMRGGLEMQRRTKPSSFPAGWPSMQQSFSMGRKQAERTQKNDIMYQRLGGQSTRIRPLKLRQAIDEQPLGNTGWDGRLGMHRRVHTQPPLVRRLGMRQGFGLDNRQEVQSRFPNYSRVNGKAVMQKKPLMGGMNSRMNKGTTTMRMSGADERRAQKFTKEDEESNESMVVPMRRLREE